MNVLATEGNLSIIKAYPALTTSDVNGSDWSWIDIIQSNSELEHFSYPVIWLPYQI